MSRFLFTVILHSVRAVTSSDLSGCRFLFQMVRMPSLLTLMKRKGDGWGTASMRVVVPCFGRKRGRVKAEGEEDRPGDLPPRCE